MWNIYLCNNNNNNRSELKGRTQCSLYNNFPFASSHRLPLIPNNNCRPPPTYVYYTRVGRDYVVRSCT